MIKKLCIIVLLSISTNCFADDTFEVNGALYSVSSRGDYVIFEGLVNKESIKNYRIPETITYNTRTIAVKGIGAEAFKDWVNLEILTIPSSIEKIETFYFYYSSKYKYFSKAFENCKSLKKLIFEDSPKTLELPDYLKRKGNSTSYERELLFDDCCIEYIYIGRDMTGRSNNFINQPLSKIEIGPCVTELDGYYGHNGGPAKTFKTITIPENVKKIGGFGFCENLEEVIIIGNGLTEIKEQAFYQCQNLKTINLPESLEKIGDSAFTGCDNITEINMGDNVTTVGFQAFCNCDRLSRLTIGSNMKRIGKEVFKSSPNIKAVISRMDDPKQCQFDSEPFESSTYANAILYVPIGKRELYTNSYYWKKFFNIQESAKATDINVSDKETNNVVIEGEKLILKGFMPLDNIMLFDANGRLKYKSKITNEDTHYISLSNYPKGVYFVKINEKTYKFIR